jgi:ATP-dependent RNA helicase DDX55/SPB4
MLLQSSSALQGSYYNLISDTFQKKKKMPISYAFFARELATQTFQVLNQFLENRPSTSDQASCSSDSVTPFLKAMLLIGGTGARSIKQDLSEFQEYGANILVATPGRLEEFLFGYSSLNKRKTNDLSEFKQRSQFKTLANLKSLEVLVLDEADRSAEFFL